MDAWSPWRPGPAPFSRPRGRCNLGGVWRGWILLALGAILAPASLPAAVDGPRPAPGVRLEVAVADLPYPLDALAPYHGLLLVSAGAPAPGGRLLRYPADRDHEPIPARAGEAVLWSRTRLYPLLAFPLTGRIHAGDPERGRVLQLSSQWEPEPLVVGLSDLQDLAVRPDGRLLVADADRILESPIYVVPPVDAGRLATIHRCRGVCLGVAALDASRLAVLEAEAEIGRVLTGEPGALAPLGHPLPRPGAGLRRDRAGALYLVADGAALRLGPGGTLSPLVIGLSRRARVSVGASGALLIADPATGAVLRARWP